MRSFIASDLPRLTSFLRTRLARAYAGPELRSSHQAVSLHVALDGGIRPHRTDFGIGLCQCSEVVVVQLIAPVRMIAILETHSLGDGHRHRAFAAVNAHGAAQGTDWVVRLTKRRVVPARDSTGGEADITTGHRMRPGLLGKRADCALERSALRGSAQKRTDHGEPKSRPQGGG